MFVKMIKVMKKDCLIFSIICLIVLGFAALIEFLMSLETNKYVDASTIFFIWIVCAIFLFISFGGGTTSLFNLSIGMGVTRKSFVIHTWILSVIKYGAVFLLGFINHKINQEFLSGKEIFNVNYFFKPDVCIILIIILTSVEMMMGSLVMRFGTKCYWVLWGIYLLMCMLPSSIEKVMGSKEDSILKSFYVWIAGIITNITRLQVISIGVVAAIVLIGISSYIFMTQDVTA